MTATAALRVHDEARRQKYVDELDLGSPLNEESYDCVIRLIRAASGLPVCLFSVLDGDRQFFKSCEGLPVRETPRAHAFCQHAIVQDDLEKIFVVADASRDARFSENPLVTGASHVRFYAGAPVRAPGGAPVGTLCVISNTPGALTPGIREALLSGRKLLEDQLKLYATAIRDPLTGLYNRRFLDDALKHEWRGAHRDSRPLSLMLVDIDLFKHYNDRYGHQQGDRALVAIAERLLTICDRPHDMVARYGGEEFLVVLPGTDSSGTRNVARKVIDSVTALGIPHICSPQKIVTVSIGGAAVDDWPSHDNPDHNLVKLADEALYAAKAAGRNNFKLSTPV